MVSVNAAHVGPSAAVLDDRRQDACPPHHLNAVRDRPAGDHTLGLVGPFIEQS
jgi:hypothetical protein